METETISRYESWKIWLKVWQRKKNLVFVFVRRQIYLLTKMKTRDFCSVKLWYAMLSILQTLLWVKTTIIKMCFGYWNFDLLLELTVLFSLHLSSNFIIYLKLNISGQVKLVKKKCVLICDNNSVLPELL